MAREHASLTIPETCGQMITKTAINIDCLNDSELRELLAHPCVHDAVKRYASLHQRCRALRLSGIVDDRLEAKMERIYERDIPEALRW